MTNYKLVKTVRNIMCIITFCFLIMVSLSPATVAAQRVQSAGSPAGKPVAAGGPTGQSTSTSFADQCTKSFFGLEPWFKFLPDADFYGSQATTNPGESKCDIKCFNVLDQGSGQNDCGKSESDMPLVLLAIIDDLLRITGLVALGYIIYGAFQFVTSQGNSEGAAKARTTVINALIGMAIATLAIGAVSYIGNALGS
jgi:hypothetical protein